ncbi:hypothetical protein [Streptomyces xanthochromogenes]|uniref:hypothetical protein n=1 Tax=Streptomyces xanthochromogenes TaxID=67384 RepID=UPI003414CABF
MGHRQRGPRHQPALVACLRQGLRLAREHRLGDLGWLTDAAFAYTDDSVWEPLSPPASAPSQGAVDPGLDTPADALAELLSAITRRQHEHRQRTADRLTAVLDTRLLPAELTELAWYYRAKAYKDLARNDDARTGMQHVADTGGRLAPKALRGLANLARLASDFPTALAAVPALGWEGRHHRVLGDIHCSHANTTQAVAAFEAGRIEAEQRGALGERAMLQVRTALALSFADPQRAEDELALAHQLLDGLDQRANRLLAHITAGIKNAGTPRSPAVPSSCAPTSRQPAFPTSTGSWSWPAPSTTPLATTPRPWPPPLTAFTPSRTTATSPTSPTSRTSWPASPARPTPRSAGSTDPTPPGRTGGGSSPPGNTSWKGAAAPDSAGSIHRSVLVALSVIAGTRVASWRQPECRGPGRQARLG